MWTPPERRTPSITGTIGPSSVQNDASLSQSTSSVLMEATLSHQGRGLCALAVERQGRFGTFRLSWIVRNCFTGWRTFTCTDNVRSPTRKPNSESKRHGFGLSIGQLSPNGKNKTSLSDLDLIRELQSSIMEREDGMPSSAQQEARRADLQQLFKLSEKRTVRQERQCVRLQEQLKRLVADMCLLQDQEKQLRACLQESLDYNSRLQQDHARQMQRLRKKTDNHLQKELEKRKNNLQVEVSAAMEEKDQQLLAAREEIASLKEELGARKESSQNSSLQQDSDSVEKQTWRGPYLQQMQRLREEMDICLQKELSKAKDELEKHNNLHTEASVAVEEKDEQSLAARGEIAPVRKRRSWRKSLDESLANNSSLQQDHAHQMQQLSEAMDISLQTELSEAKEKLEKPTASQTFAIGIYQIIRAAIVKDGSEPDSEKVADLFPNSFVHVLEVADFEDRVRARIEEPPGWISIVNKTTGMLYATKATTSSSPEPSSMMSAMSSLVDDVELRSPASPLAIDDQPVSRAREKEKEVVHQSDLGVCDVSETFAVGTYQIIRAAIVKQSSDIDSKKVADVFPNSFVNVLAVKQIEDRVRARIEEPPGWISIVNKNTGALYATKATTSSSLEPLSMKRTIPSLVEQKNVRALWSPGSLRAIDE